MQTHGVSFNEALRVWARVVNRGDALRAGLTEAERRQLAAEITQVLRDWR